MQNIFEKFFLKETSRQQMPQLDQFTYLTQFVWLCVFYMSFYVLLFNDGLPKVSRIFKLRKHLVSQQVGDTLAKSQNVEQDVVFPSTLNSSVSYLYSSVSAASKWCSNMLTSINTNQLKTMNKSYVRSLGEMSLSQVLKNSALDSISPITFMDSNLRSINLIQIYMLRVQKSLLGGFGKQTRKKKKS
uniref:H(+)-transporting two-sector ATPase n=1 Tax=Gonatozygon brebissonii TaxID=184482 RepID=A0A6G9IF05_9VIRI|nr:ATP synthase F0 subunit 8 [Gonatozygon brebissonii]QIQ23045.1 ATP synthase F0 subunit 8 [Gonatozygon brebissonii]